MSSTISGSNANSGSKKLAGGYLASFNLKMIYHVMTELFLKKKKTPQNPHKTYGSAFTLDIGEED